MRCPTGDVAANADEMAHGRNVWNCEQSHEEGESGSNSPSYRESNEDSNPQSCSSRNERSKPGRYLHRS